MSRPVIKLDDKIDQEQTLGTLIVVILKARNLHDKHTFRKQDVFGQATLNGIEKRTQVDIKGGQHPVWDSELRFTIMKSTAAKHRKLEVACYAKEPREDDLLGKCVVDISETVRTGEFDDWVGLEVEGSKRGEVYLEMTYFSNAPPPVSQGAPNNKHLTQVLSANSNNLQRRPSKLSPADRLSRPVQQSPPAGRPGYVPPGPSKLAGSPPYTPPTQPHQQLPPVNQSAGLPASLAPSRPNGASPKGRNDTLPSLPPQAQAQGSAPFPSILRPGPGGPSVPQNIPRPQQYGHHRHPSASPPSTPGYYTPQAGTSPQASNPYIGGGGRSGGSTPAPGMAQGPTYTPHPASHHQHTLPPASVPPQNPYVYTASPPPPAAAPLLWQDTPAPAPGPSGGFSFPVPIIPAGGPLYSSPPSGPSGYNGYGGYPPLSRMGDDRSREELNPHLQTRYQSPLPLPPGAEARPAPAPAATLAPPETPPPAWSPATPPKDDILDRRREAELAAERNRREEEENKERRERERREEERRERERKEKEKRDNEAIERAERLRKQEEYDKQVARKREQEKRDLELAMQLDRELNLEEVARMGSGTSRTTASMPGQW